MLINYSFKNYLSFKEESTLSLEPGKNLRKFPNNVIRIDFNKGKSHTKLLKNIIIFGSNASGKSNLISSLALMQRMILHPTTTVTAKLPVTHFLLDQQSRHNNSMFEVELIQNDRQYRYSFSYNEEKIVSEKLERFERGQYTTYFERVNTNDFVIIPDKLARFTDETRDNSLFLYVAQEKNDDAAIDVFSWFEDTLEFYQEHEMSELFHLLQEETIKTKFLEIMRLADMKFIDVEVEKDQLLDGLSEQEVALMRLLGREREIVDKLYTVYKQYNEEGDVVGKQRLPLSLESAGTKKFIHLMLNLLAMQQDHKVLIMDEFNNAFHEELASALIKIVNMSTNQSQFIFTSHELDLMDADLRKDQIYFVEKDFTGVSELYSIFDFSDFRADIGYYKRYQKGLFGAIPYIDIEALVEVFSSKEV